jgi:hypothetical protein
MTMDTDHDTPLPEESRREADERLVHALLVHLHDGQAAEQREQRVQRALRAIRGPAASAAGAVPAHRPVAWIRRGAWTAAAAFLVAAGLLVFLTGTPPAMASLNDILNALGRPGDRTYRIHMEDQPAPPERRPPGDRPPEPVPRPGLDDATLHLRDGNQYLLVRNDPKGGVLYDGYDGRQSWRIRAGVVAETRDGLGAGGIPMPPIMANVPFSDLHGTLEQIRIDYTVEQFDAAPLPSGVESLRHVRVRRNSREVRGPETIEIWADATTGLPRRIVFDRAKLQGNRQPCQLTFELISADPLPSDWFAPAPHTTSGKAADK